MIEKVTEKIQDVTNSIIERTAYLQGISDYMRYRTRCPLYWRDKPEGKAWAAGYKYGREFNKS